MIWSIIFTIIYTKHLLSHTTSGVLPYRYNVDCGLT